MQPLLLFLLKWTGRCTDCLLQIISTIFAAVIGWMSVFIGIVMWDEYYIDKTQEIMDHIWGTNIFSGKSH